jgi:hypothetical protein
MPGNRASVITKSSCGVRRYAQARPHYHFPSPRLTGVPYNSNAATFTYPPEPWPLPGHQIDETDFIDFG